MKIRDYLTSNLQLFADPNTQTTEQQSMSPQMKEFYRTALLENSRPELYVTQFAKHQPLPKNGGKSVEFRRANTFKPALKPLTEGVTPNGSNFGYTAIHVSINQYGDYSTLSDRLELEAVDNVIVDATEEHGANAGITLNLLGRNEIICGTQVYYAGDKKYRHKLTVNDKFTSSIASVVATHLKKTHAPKINGSYIGLIHPSVAEDLRHDPEWLAPHQYVNPENIYNGEIGKLHGIRFIEDSEQKVYCGDDLASDARDLAVNGAVSEASEVTFDGGTVEANSLVGRYVLIGDGRYYITANTTTKMTLVDDIDHTTPASITAADNTPIYPGEGGAEGIAVYAVPIFGKDAYTDIEPDAESLDVIVKPRGSGGTSDPLDQRSTVGWKASYAAKITQGERLVRVECASTKFSTIDKAN